MIQSWKDNIQSWKDRYSYTPSREYREILTIRLVSHANIQKELGITV
jgi:hypothetical protein